jgi:hypothetical protein
MKKTNSFRIPGALSIVVPSFDKKGTVLFLAQSGPFLEMIVNGLLRFFSFIEKEIVKITVRNK